MMKMEVCTFTQGATVEQLLQDVDSPKQDSARWMVRSFLSCIYSDDCKKERMFGAKPSPSDSLNIKPARGPPSASFSLPRC